MSRHGEMRYFAVISHNKVMVPLEWRENVVQCGKKVFIYLDYEGRYSTLKNRLRKKSDFEKKARKTQLKFQHINLQKFPDNRIFDIIL